MMSRDRYRCMELFFHLADNNIRPKHPLDKIDIIRKRLNEVSNDLFENAEWLTIDEHVVECKHRTKLLTYNSMKPHKWGIRVYKSSESKSAVTLNYEVCLGKYENNRIKNKLVRIISALVS